MVIQKVAVKAVNPQWLLLTGWAEIPSYSQNELLPLNTEEELSRVRPLPTVSSHQGLQLLHSSHSLTALGAQTLPRPPLPWPKQGQAELRTALLQEQDALLDQIFPLKTHVGFISGSIHCVHWFLLQTATSHFTPLWLWVLPYLLMLPLKGAADVSKEQNCFVAELNFLQKNHFRGISPLCMIYRNAIHFNNLAPGHLSRKRIEWQNTLLCSSS